jgi:hypothetical protein
VSRLVVRHGVFHRNSLRGGLGEDAPASVAVPVTELTELRSRTDRIIEKLEEQNRARKWTLMIGGASALFAAVKLGLVTFGAIKSRSGS